MCSAAEGRSLSSCRKGALTSENGGAFSDESLTLLMLCPFFCVVVDDDGVFTAKLNALLSVWAIEGL